ncbi:unnamed protein product [Cunninghamella blakesleeana]
MSLVEVIQNPLQTISVLFAKHLSDSSKTPINFNPSPHFNNLFNDHKNLIQVPSLNHVSPTSLKKNHLVRFRCMIQDTGLGQEMFVAAYKKSEKDVCKTLCYRYTDDLVDIEHHDNDIPNDYLSERSIVYCVSPPGETIWSKSYMTDLSDHLSNVTIESVPLKHHQQQNKKFPLPGVDHIGMIVKFYDNMESIRVGQLVDVIGILGNTLSTTTDHHEQDALNDFDSHLSQYNGTMVLHAITYLPVQPTSPFTQQQITDTLQQARDIRDPLINYIAGSFGGDKLVAEFVLFQLLSKVSNQHHGMKLGQFSLNVTKIPESTIVTKKKEEEKEKEIKTAPSLELNNTITKPVNDMLSSLICHHISIPLTIDHLNKSQYTPKSINENLSSGILQLVPGTRILIDETELSEGQLVDQGVRNMQAIMNIILNQTLSYTFPFSQYDFDTDLGIITLSTKKSLLPNHCTIPLEPIFPLDQNQIENRSLPSKQELDAFRIYLQGARNANYEISESISQFIQNQFVEERKQASEQKLPLPTQEDLMLRMNLCRLVALSFGETQLTKETYEYVVHLDQLRKSRINS